MRYQLLLDKVFNFDIENYCKDNHLEKQDMIRHLIREEIYRRQSLAKIKSTFSSGTTNAPKRAGKSKNDK